jgi:hypothetical protein
MKQKQKPQTNMMASWPVVAGVLVVLLTAFYIAVQQVKAPDQVEDKTASMQQNLPVIEDTQGLNEAQKELDEVNPDDMDTEITELEKDSAAF